MSKHLETLFKTMDQILGSPCEEKDRIEQLKVNLTKQLIETVFVGFLGLVIWTFLCGRAFHPVPIMIPIFSVLCLKLRAYRSLVWFGFIIELISPFATLHSSDFIVTPGIILLSSYNSFIFTRSTKFTIIHIGFNIIMFSFYGSNHIISRFSKLTPDEIAFYYKQGGGTVLFAAVTFGFGLCSLDYGLNNLINQLNSLKIDLDELVSKLNAQNIQLAKNIELKEVFIYSFSHELKNALNGLLGNLFLALTEVKDQQTLSFLNNAKVCGEVLKNFIHNILDSGKLENGNLEVSLDRTDVANFIGNFWAICGELIRNKRLEGIVKVSKDVPKFLELDQQRLLQILLNFTSNSVKFTEKGQISFKVSWEPLDNSRQRNIIQSLRGRSRNNEENFETEQTRERFDRLIPKGSRATHFFENDQYFLNFANRRLAEHEALDSKAEPGSEGFLKIEVTDTGCGMTPKDQQALFKKFSQVGNSNANRKIGTGLGLWICRELLNRMEGDVNVKSAVGIGTTFEIVLKTQVSFRSPTISGGYIELPTKANTDQASDVSQPINSALMAGSRKKTGFAPKSLEMRSKFVLVVDDDSFNMELMKNFMKRLGTSALCAYNGEEAIEVYKAHQKEIGLVLTDNHMPRMTGIEAAREIQRLNRQNDKYMLPIYCLSGDSKLNEGDQSALAGFISKPIEFDNVKSILRNHGLIK